MHNKSAPLLDCNKRTTRLQQDCNKTATRLQQECSTTRVQSPAAEPLLSLFNAFSTRHMALTCILVTHVCTRARVYPGTHTHTHRTHICTNTSTGATHTLWQHNTRVFMQMYTQAHTRQRLLRLPVQHHTRALTQNSKFPYHFYTNYPFKPIPCNIQQIHVHTHKTASCAFARASDIPLSSAPQGHAQFHTRIQTTKFWYLVRRDGSNPISRTNSISPGTKIVPVEPRGSRKTFLASKLRNSQPQHIQRREILDLQMIKYKYKFKTKTLSHPIYSKHAPLQKYLL